MKSGKNIIIFFILVLLAGRLNAGKTENHFSKNLVYNGSFELGDAGFACNYLVFPNKKTQDRKNIWNRDAVKVIYDSSSYVHGKMSLKIENPYENFFCVVGGPWILKPAKNYTVSVWMKSDKDKYPVRILIQSVALANGKSKWKGRSKLCVLSKKWKRYYFMFKLPENAIHKYFNLRIETVPVVSLLPRTFKNIKIPRNIWIDSIQVEEGKLTDFSPASPIECAISLNTSFPVYMPGAKVSGTLKVVNYNLSIDKTICKISVYNDYSGKELLSLKKNLGGSREGEKIEMPFEFNCRKRGGYGIHCTITDSQGTKISESYDVFFVVTETAEARSLVSPDDFSLGINFNPFSAHYWGCPASRHALLCRPGIKNIFKYYACEGIRWFRDVDKRPAFCWRDVEPEQGRFNWDGPDYFVAHALKYNIRILPVLGKGGFEDNSAWKHFCPKMFPDWVIRRAEKKLSPFPFRAARKAIQVLPKLDDWEHFISAVVSRYKGKISHYEIMDEPNLYLKPSQYVKYLKAAYKAAKTANPDCKIVGMCATGDFGGQLINFIDACCKLGALNYCDIVSFHPYDARLGGSAQHMIRELRQIMKKYGQPDKPIWNTELYYMNLDMKAGFIASQFKADKIVRRFFIDLGEGLQQSIPLQRFANVRRTIFHKRAFWNIAKISPSFRYVIYAQLARYFQGAKPISRINWPNRDICYVVKTKNGVPAAAIWNYDRRFKDIVTLNIEPASVRVLDMFGNPIKVKQVNKLVFRLGNEPFYIFAENLNEKDFLSALKNAEIECEKPVFIEGVRLNSDKMIIFLRNSSGKSVKGFIKLTNTPKWLKSSGAVAYGPIKRYSAMPVSIPIRIENKTSEKRTGTATIVISTALRQFEFKISVFRPLILKCGKISSPPVIDGRINDKEWENCGKAFLKNRKNIKSGNAGKWGGIKDCSAVLYAGCDQNFLYLAVSVRDDMTGKRTDGMPWTGDAIEFFIDTSDKPGSKYNEKTWQIIVAPEAKHKGPVINVVHGEKYINIKWSTKRIKTGYSAEVAIPLKNSGIKISRKNEIGFDFAIDDADESAWKFQMIWSGNKDSYCNRTYFGRLILKK